MGDDVDQAQEYINIAESTAIQAVRNKMQAMGNENCRLCGETIPEARRQAVPWADSCATCQDIIEHRQRVGDGLR